MKKEFSSQKSGLKKERSSRTSRPASESGRSALSDRSRSDDKPKRSSYGSGRPTSERTSRSDDSLKKSDSYSSRAASGRPYAKRDDSRSGSSGGYAGRPPRSRSSYSEDSSRSQGDSRYADRGDRFEKRDTDERSSRYSRTDSYESRAPKYERKSSFDRFDRESKKDDHSGLTSRQRYHAREHDRDEDTVKKFTSRKHNDDMNDLLEESIDREEHPATVDTSGSGENDSGSQNCIYGIHAVEELLKTRLTAIDHIYISKDKKSPELFELMKQCRKERLSYNLVPEIRIDQFCQSSKHQGVVAFCSVKEYISSEDLKSKVIDKSDALILLPASVEDPGNLGAMIRSAVAFNVDAMILERKNTSPLNASVAKSAAGMVEHMSIARPKNIEALIEEFKEKNFAVIGADATKGVSPDKLDLTGPVILVLGGEHRGIPPYLDKKCTAFVSIPISETVQSLNVSAAAAVLLYECTRQRNAK